MQTLEANVNAKVSDNSFGELLNLLESNEYPHSEIHLHDENRLQYHS